VIVGEGAKLVIDRLGNVLYWAACLLAVAVIGFGVFVFYSTGGGPVDRALFLLAMFGGVAIVIWLIGRAIRYVLSGL
jgi:hypothetical protein